MFQIQILNQSEVDQGLLEESRISELENVNKHHAMLILILLPKRRSQSIKIDKGNQPSRRR